MGYLKGYCTPTTKISYYNEGDGPRTISRGGGRPSYHHTYDYGSFFTCLSCNYIGWENPIDLSYWLDIS